MEQKHPGGRAVPQDVFSASVAMPFLAITNDVRNVNQEAVV